MKKLAQTRAMILGIHGVQYNVTDPIRKHFMDAVVSAVSQKDHDNKIGDVERAYNAFLDVRVSPITGFAQQLNISESSLQKLIIGTLQSWVMDMPVKHIKHDTKLCKMTHIMKRYGVNMATLTSLSADYAAEFYRVAGLRNLHTRDSIFGHEDVDYTLKIEEGAYWPALSYLGYKSGDDLSSVLFVDNNRQHLECAKAMGMMTAMMGEKDRGLCRGQPFDFEYRNIKVLMHEIHAAKEEAGEYKYNQRSWASINHY